MPDTAEQNQRGENHRGVQRSAEQPGTSALARHAHNGRRPRGPAGRKAWAGAPGARQRGNRAPPGGPGAQPERYGQARTRATSAASTGKGEKGGRPHRGGAVTAEQFPRGKERGGSSAPPSGQGRPPRPGPAPKGRGTGGPAGGKAGAGAPGTRQRGNRAPRAGPTPAGEGRTSTNKSVQCHGSR